METLEELRARLDTVDTELVGTVARRLELCRNVAHLKKTRGMIVIHPEREEQVKQRCAKLGASLGLSETFVRALYTLIIDEARRLEKEIAPTSEG